MYRDKERYKQDPTIVIRSKSNFKAPLQWKEPQLIFTCSWSDWFIEEADLWRDEAWAIIKATPQHTYQILTKRPERIKDHLPADWGSGYPNVWLGVSVENQQMADERIPELLRIHAVVRFLSLEPLLGPVDVTQAKINYSAPTRYDSSGRGIEWTDPGPAFIGVDWIILGGESGNEIGKYRYRPAELQWFMDIIGQCAKANVPVFVKQLGTHLAKLYRLKDRHGGDITEWNWPIKIRQFPHIYKVTEIAA